MSLPAGGDVPNRQFAVAAPRYQRFGIRREEKVVRLLGEFDLLLTAAQIDNRNFVLAAERRASEISRNRGRRILMLDLSKPLARLKVPEDDLTRAGRLLIRRLLIRADRHEPFAVGGKEKR